jgi:5-formyltetrahydrofolate cyclo-ligase
MIMGEHLRLPKSELRQRVSSARRQRSPGEMHRISQAISDQVCRLTAFALARHVVAYAARSDEVDPSAIVDHALAASKIVYYPRVAGAGLEFVACRPRDLRPGTFGVPEPGTGPRLEPGAPGILFLVPGLAFDPHGVRLGRGGGHYDRALSAHPSGLRLGLVPDADLAARLPSDAWDQAVDAVATERRLLWCARQPEPAGKENAE